EYFPSKQVLFQEMLVQAMDGYTTFLNVPSSPNSTVRNRVERIFRMHLTFLLENKEFLALTCSDMGTMDQELVRWMHELRRQKMDRLIEILNEGVQKGEIRPMDIELAANIIHGLLHIAVVPAFIEEKDFNPGDLAKDLSQIVFEGIGLR
ncbi:MAG: TetR/AcrR family transcriptional regulator, partial [Chitinophagales bacterium]